METQEAVYTGLWRNWELGTWASYTVTLPITQGLFLVSFITLFIRWCGGYLWDIIAFGIHQWRSTPEATNVLQRQLQVLLRNSGGPMHAFWTSIKLLSRWNKKMKGVWGPCIFTAVPPMVILGGTALAAFFSSQLLSPRDHVLVGSDTCGWLADGQFTEDNIYSNDETTQRSDSLWVSGVQTAEKSMEYARGCYEGTSIEYTSLCNAFITPRITSTVDRAAQCPFNKKDVCSEPAVRLDSGFVDSASQLGINSPPENKVQVRKVSTCASLGFQRYASGWGPPPFPTDPSDPIAIWKIYDIYDPDAKRWIALRNDSSYFTPRGYGLWTSNNFEGDAAQRGNLSPDQLRHDLKAAQTDQIIFQLQNMALYSENVSDAFFRASAQNDSRGYSKYTIPDLPNAWYPDVAVSALGCTEQYQFCANSHCTEPSGLFTIDPTSLNLTAPQKAIYNVMWKSLWAANWLFVSTFLPNGKFLLASRLLHPMSGISAPVAPDQWVREVENLHNISLAVLQRRIVEYSRPPAISIRPAAGISTRQFIIPPATEEGRSVCANIKTRNPSYRSFSLASLLAILLGGLLIVATSLILPKTVFAFRRRRQAHNEKAAYKSRAWIDVYVFHLYRLVLENISSTLWEDTDNDIPVPRGIQTSSTKDNYHPGPVRSNEIPPAR